MGEPRQFAYYYGIEAEQFAFYRVPRLLIKDKRFRNLSSDAKLLYGLMLDRMSLSMKNGWLDEENRAYIIYTVENMMEDLGCSKPTCVKIMRELDSEKGIGLIEKKRRGLGKPDIIYVKNFSAPAETPVEEAAEKPDNPGISPEVKNLYFKKERNFTSGSKGIELLEVKETDAQKERNFTSRGKENYPAKVKDFSPNYTDYNQTDRNQINPINPSWQQAEPETGIDRMMEASRYMEMVRTNIEYELYMQDKQWADRDLFHELYEAICEIVCIKRESVRIGGEDYPYELVKAKFLKLNSSHLLYVIGCMHATTTKISNIKAYMLTALYNAPITMNHYYQQEVQHDMHGGGWHEKGII